MNIYTDAVPMSDESDDESDLMIDELPSYNYIEQKFSHQEAQSVINRTEHMFEELCSLADIVHKVLEDYLEKDSLKSGTIYIVDGFNEACRFRTATMTKFDNANEAHAPFCCHTRGCPCSFSDIIRQQSHDYKDDVLFVVNKDPNFNPNKKSWATDMKLLSNLHNVVMFPMEVDSMDICTQDFYYERSKYKMFLDSQKSLKIREHDDLGVLLLYRIIRTKYPLRECYIVSNDKYRDKELVVTTTPPYYFNILNNSQLLFTQKVNPTMLNSFKPCTCNNWSCIQKNTFVY